MTLLKVSCTFFHTDEATDDDILTLLLQLASTPSQQTQSSHGNQATPDGMSVADALVHSACSGLADRSLSHSLMDETVLLEKSFLATQLSNADKSIRENTTEASLHECNLPFTQTPPTPSTPLQKLNSFSFCDTHSTAIAHSADGPLSTDLLSTLAPRSPGQLSIGNEANTNPDLNSMLRLLCDHQNDEAESLLMSQAFWGTEDHHE